MEVVSQWSRREQLAQLWCNWNGQKGTARQIARIRCTEEQLERMLAERGVAMGAAGEMVISRRPVTSKACGCKADCQRWLPCTCACHEEGL